MSISAEDKEHLVKDELYNHFAQYQAGIERAPIERFTNWLYSFTYTRAPAIIDTTNYNPTSAEAYSESQMVNRTAFALRKINEFNPHFFTLMEQRTIEPVKLGVISNVAKVGFVGFDVGIITYLWKSWAFNVKSAAIFSGLVVGQAVVLKGSAIVKEQLHHTFKRKPLAQKYLAAYGREFMNEVVGPNYNCENLKHMHNKLKH